MPEMLFQAIQDDSKLNKMSRVCFVTWLLLTTKNVFQHNGMNHEYNFIFELLFAYYTKATKANNLVLQCWACHRRRYFPLSTVLSDEHTSDDNNKEERLG